MNKGVIMGLFLLAIFPARAFAVGSGGFENASFSSKFLAEGNAGVAQANEPGAISYNPAGITELHGLQTQTNTHFINVFVFHHGRLDDRTRSSGTIVPVPTGYMTLNPDGHFGNRLSFGIGSDSPFGLANKFDANDANVRYAGYKNYLKMYTIKPVAALRINDKLSIGAGPIYYRVFDFGGIEAYPNRLFPGGLVTDGQVRLNLEGNRWRWHLGALYKPHPKHRFGFYFRSPVTINTRGRVKVENATSGNFETGANAKLDLPLNFTWGYAYQWTPKTIVETDFGFTRWEAHKRLYINNDPVNTRENTILRALGIVDKDYDNSFSLHLGGNHQKTEKLNLRAGSFFYTHAVPNDHYIPAVADNNKIGFSAGAGYRVMKNMDLELGYINIFNLGRRIDNSIGESLGASEDGTYYGYIQQFVITFTCRWENLFGWDGTKNETPEILGNSEPETS